MTQTHSADDASLTHTHCCPCMNSQRYILWIDSYSQNEYESETDQKYWREINKIHISYCNLRQFCKTFTDKAEGKVECLRVYSSKVKAAWVEALFTSAAVNNLTLRSCCYSHNELHFTSHQRHISKNESRLYFMHIKCSGARRYWLCSCVCDNLKHTREGQTERQRQRERM